MAPEYAATPTDAPDPAAVAARMQPDTLRPRLIKIGGRVRELADCVHRRLASSRPGEPLWRPLAARPNRHPPTQ